MAPYEKLPLRQVQSHCEVCEQDFAYMKEGPGRRRITCSDPCAAKRANGTKSTKYAKLRGQGESPAEILGLKPRSCIVCGSDFQSYQSQASCCSKACVNVRKSEAIARRSQRIRAERTRDCAHCGEAFQPFRLNGAQRKAGYVQACCSIQCAGAMRVKPVAPAKTRKCKTCGGDIVLGGRSSYCSAECKVRARSKLSLAYKCIICESQYAPISTGGRPKVTCSASCHRRLQLGRAAQQAARERAKIGSVVDLVIPDKVFERDLWTCQCCQRLTPQAARGTLALHAPELDHIKPLSAGGDHTYENTQCLCRECNAAKGDHLFPPLKISNWRAIWAQI